MVRALGGIFAPARLSERVVQADFTAELQHNQGLRGASRERQQEYLQNLRTVTSDRLRLLRQRLVASGIWLASAVAAALVLHALPVFRASAGALAAGSVFCFAMGTLGQLGWAGQSIKGETVPERLDRLVVRVLYWLGMYLAAAAVM